MKFDTFLATVDDWGRYQKVKYTLICLTYMLPPIMVYTYTFTAGKPSFRCANPTAIGRDGYNSSSNELFNKLYKPTKDQCNNERKKFSLADCQSCNIQWPQSNQSSSNTQLKKCDKFVYDRKHYTKTLVEEVRFKKKANFYTDFKFILSGQWFVIVLLIDQQFK